MSKKALESVRVSRDMERMTQIWPLEIKYMYFKKHFLKMALMFLSWWWDQVQSLFFSEIFGVLQIFPDKHILSSVQLSCSVTSDSLRPHGSQHARPPCPSPTARVYLNSCPLSR